MIRAVIFDMYETLITHYESPLYFGPQMAEDAGISEEKFQKLWRPTESDRSVGIVSFEETIEMILRKNQCYSETVFQKIMDKRIKAKEECFHHLHKGILPLLQQLKKEGYLIGLISNCFSEEAKVIRESLLFPYFDGVCLSYEVKMQKPQVEIFYKCMRELGVKPWECLYVGDGGSEELETARSLGMEAVQAVWYLKKGAFQPSARNPEFPQMEDPGEVLRYCSDYEQ